MPPPFSSALRGEGTVQRGCGRHPRYTAAFHSGIPGEPSQAVVVRYAAIESPYPAVKGRSASKLPVFTPGRVALRPNATPNLNIGIDFWSASPAVPAVQEEASHGLALARRDSVTLLVERELKGERQKQSNRESARRSRLRKQVV
ncbi:hypothetical protein PVAP13_7KG111000 [Panicum virgatum]|uniref:BZIP domain-containing protein n=1 Tax=Panicum virgatum TaxID=38727 RepID=A0A8T0Q931_PANVG|nr:hypothetical protein PVAP13_7KG111000 [Panicum virgatum]